MPELSKSARRIQDILIAHGLSERVRELPAGTRTAEDAARAIGCRVEQIAKSLVFAAARTGRPILVVASGANRVREAGLAELLGEPVEKADARFVRERTGFAIGGVPPLGHSERLETFLDEDLFFYSEIWAAAGTPNAVFLLAPTDLLRITSGRVVAVK